jgi:O-antigen/teichoic acid export membrane protein
MQTRTRTLVFPGRDFRFPARPGDHRSRTRVDETVVYNCPMSQNVRRVSRQLLAYGTADAAVLAINFLLLPLYTRVLSPTEYGALTLLLVFEAFLKPTLRCGLDSAYLRLYFDVRLEEDRRTLATTVLVFLLALNGAALTILWAAGPWLTRSLLGSGDYVAALRLVALHTVLSNFVFLPLNLFRAQERSSLVGLLTFVRSFATVGTRLVLVVGLKQGVFGLALADVIVTSAFVVGLARPLWGMVGGRLSLPVLRAALRYGFPQVPNGLLSQVMAMSDRYVLGMRMSLRDVGVYSIGSTMASILKLFPVAFETAWMPFAYSSLTRPDAPAVFARLGSYAFAILCFAALAVTLLAQPLTILALPVSFHQAPTVVPVLALGITIQAAAWFLATSLNVAKQTSRYPFTTAAGAVASLLASLALVPSFGAIGAAVGVLCGQTVLTITTAWFAQRCYRIPYDVPRLLKAAVVTVALFGVGIALRGASAWVNLAVAVALVAAFPPVLLGAGYLQHWELVALWQLVRWRRAAGGPAAVPSEPAPRP